MYPGQAKKPDEIAVIAAADGHVSVAAITGRRYDNAGQELGVNAPVFTYQLLPGLHAVQLVVLPGFPMSQQSRQILLAQSAQQVTLKAGHTYLPRAEMIEDHLRIWLEDMGTGFDLACYSLRGECAR